MKKKRSSRKRGGMTLAEHDALLKEEGRYEAMVAEHQRRERERLKRQKELRTAERPLIEELRAAGFVVDTAWDFVNTNVSYPEAVPILLRHLQKDYPDRVREGIARALAVPESKSAWETLRDEFERSEDPTSQGAKWGIACALSVAGHDDVIDDVLRLLAEKRHVRNRVPLLDILARSELERAARALEAMCDDPEIGHDARELIAKKKKKKRRRKKR